MDIKSIRPPTAGVEAIQGVERSAPLSPLQREDQPQPKPAAVPDPQELASAVEELNAHAHSTQRDLEFSIDDSSGQTVVKVVDPQSGEVIRQIPSELALNLAQALRAGNELQTGLIVSEQA